VPSEKTTVEAEVIELPPKGEEKKKPRGRPTNAEKFKAELEQRRVERQAFIENHPLILANPAPTEVNSAVGRLILVKHQMAREAAALEFNRGVLDMEGKETATVSSRIVSTLDKMSGIDLEIKKLGNVVVDPRSEEVQKMAALWIKTLSDTVTGMVADQSMDTQTMDLLFNKFSAALEGWEDRVDGGD
jgi:hypothetical protein